MPTSKTFLLVDDDLDDQEIFKSALGEISASITCLTANTGDDALQKLQGNTEYPDLIFLDMNMPGMTGVDTLKALKTDKALQHIPVIMYSTTAIPQHVNETAALGALQFITKPTNFTELCELLKMIVAKQ